MKTKTIVLASVLSLAIFVPATAFAQDATATPTPRLRQELRNIRVEDRNEVKDLRTGLRTTITQDRNEFRKNRMTINQNGLYKSFQTRLKALQDYQARIQTRLDAKKVKLPGNQSLADAQTKIDSLSAMYTTFNTDLSAYKATIDSITTSSNPTSLLPTLKTEAKTVNTDIKNIRANLVAALRLVIQAK